MCCEDAFKAASDELCCSLQATDSLTAFLGGLVYDLIQFCIFEIESTLDNTSDDPERQPDFVNSLVRQVEDLSCPGEPSLCSGHGTCTRGRCVCDAGTLKRVQTNAYCYACSERRVRK